MAAEKLPEDQALDALMAWAHQRGHYGQKYEESKSLNELLAWLGEAVCISAFRIVQSLKPPRRGRLLLNIMKSLARSSYDSYLQTRNNLFAESMFYVADRLCKALRSWARVPNPEHIANQAVFIGAGTFAISINMQDEEKQRFYSVMTKKLIYHEDNPPRDTTESLSRIVDARGKLPRNQVLSFLKSAVVQDPLDLIEPHVFASKYLELSSL
jgi:hypothetical protein